MKVYSISKWAFFGICALIVSLPFSRHWRLLTLGESSTGTVKEFNMIVHTNIAGEKEIQHASEIHFILNDSVHIAHGPPDLEYKTGRKIRLRYNSADPSEYILLTFSAIYLNDYVTLPLVLLTVWAAFYLSFNSYSKRKSKHIGSDLAFSPFKTWKPARDPDSNGMVKELENHFSQQTKGNEKV